MSVVLPGSTTPGLEGRFLHEGWTFCSTEPDALKDPSDLEQSPRSWRSVRVPGTVGDAMRSSLERDGFPDLDDQDHWFRCSFSGARPDSSSAPGSSRAPAGGEATELWLHGLATVCEIWLNGQRLGESTNMFVRTRWEIGALLEERNVLVLCFRALGPRLRARRPRARWRTRLVSERNLRFFRTTLLGRMPSWCPPVSAIGPWREVELRTRPETGLRCGRVGLEPRMQGEGGRLAVDIELECAADPAIGMQLLAPGALALDVEGTRFPVVVEPLAPGRLRVTGEARWAHVEPWWPHTHGAARRYPVALETPLTGEASRIELGHVGFRRVEVIGPPGPGFRIELNGEALFCRGTCWTPVDAIRLQTSRESLREALEQARDAGINMLRVAGTTVYEQDEFYELCDELGILVWQDFMFATLDYPAEDPDFLASVTTEVEQFLERTRHRACLTVLCGNSEGQQQPAMLGLPASSWSSGLFDARLPELCAALRPDVPFWTSTPSGGELPFHTRSGTSHYFGVGAYRRPLSDARLASPHFMTECLAFANLPGVHGPDTTPRERIPQDSGADWDFQAVTDHYAAVVFGESPDEARDPTRAAALRRATSAEMMHRAQALWRDPGSGCGGSLVWLHRDPWRCAGWGVVDAEGRPKSAYYGLRRAWAPIAIAVLDDGLNGLRLQIHNDRDQSFEAEVEVVLMRFDGTRIREHRRAVALPARSHLDRSIDAWLEGFVDSSHAYRFGTREFDLCIARLLAPEDSGSFERPELVSCEAVHWPFGHALPASEPIGLRAEWLEDEASGPWDGYATLQVDADRFVPSVGLAIEGGSAEENFFPLAPDRGRRVRVKAVADRLGGDLHALGLHAGIRLPSLDLELEGRFAR